MDMGTEQNEDWWTARKPPKGKLKEAADTQGSKEKSLRGGKWIR